MTMSNWHTGRLACFDFETSGIDAFRDRAVTAAIVEVGGSGAPRTSEWLINPGIPIHPEATRVHGITDQQAAGGVDPAGAMHEIATHLLELTSHGIPVVGHNVGGYDLTMLWAELVRHGMDDLAERVSRIRPVVDTMVLDKMLDPYRKGSRRLIDTCRHYGIELADADAHGARADALAAGRLGWAICHRRGYSIGAQDLHDDLVKAKRAQAESFGKYLLKQGKPDDVAREWPIQPAPPGWSPEQLPAAREDGAA